VGSAEAGTSEKVLPVPLPQKNPFVLAQYAAPGPPHCPQKFPEIVPEVATRFVVVATFRELYGPGIPFGAGPSV